MRKNIFIKNKKGLRLACILERPEGNKKFPFILLLHGFKGYKEEENYAELAKSLCKEGMGSIRFDASGFGESEGNIAKDYRFSNYVADVESVYRWLRTQHYVDARRVGMFGHSVGGMQAIVFAANHPEIKGICITSAPYKIMHVSDFKKLLNKWQQKGLIFIRSSRYKRKIKFPFAYIEDARKWNILEDIKRVKAPLLVIIGGKDKTVLPQDTKKIYQEARGSKELIEVEMMGHDYKKNPKFLEFVNQKTLVFFKDLFQESLIRRATIKDINLIINIQKEDGFSHAYYLTSKRLKGLFKRSEIFFIAFLDNKPVGFVSVDIEKRAKLHFLSVVKDCTRMGIGSLLLNKVINEAKKYKRGTMYVYTEMGSPLEGFIIKRGFKKVGYFKGRFGKGKNANIFSYYF